jgi:hypothetical protein
MAMVRLPEQGHRAAHRGLGLTTIPEVQDLVPSSLHGRLQRERESSERTRRAINKEEEFGKIVLRVDKAPHQPDRHQDISQVREICSVPATVPRWPKRREVRGLLDVRANPDQNAAARQAICSVQDGVLTLHVARPGNFIHELAETAGLLPAVRINLQHMAVTLQPGHTSMFEIACGGLEHTRVYCFAADQERRNKWIAVFRRMGVSIASIPGLPTTVPVRQPTPSQRDLLVIDQPTEILQLKDLLLRRFLEDCEAAQPINQLPWIKVDWRQNPGFHKAVKKLPVCQ